MPVQASDEQLIQPFLEKIPASILSTAKVLKTYEKLVSVLAEYARSARNDDANTQLEKKLRPILTDSGCGRKAAAEIIQDCYTVVTEDKEAAQGEKPGGNQDQSSEESDEHENQTTTDSTQRTTITKDSSLSSVKARKQKRAERSALKSKTASASQDVDLATATAASLGLTDNRDAKLSLIHATSQETRFYVDATDSASLEIDLKDVCVSLAGNELLTNAHLRLKSGVHYGLVGRNGTGKSTLLSAIGERIIPGLPNLVKILLVSQVTTALAAEDENAVSVQDVVIRSDAERTRADDELKVLNKVLEKGVHNEKEIKSVVLTLMLRRATDRLEEARKISLRRSGARGADARKDLIAAEREHAEALKATESPDVQPPAGTTWADEAARLLTEAQTVLERVEANATEARARKILHGLGFSEAMMSGPYSALSGGWRSRASLAAALLQPAHVLLLDEPVNYLDLPAVLFVQEFIKEVPHTVVTVSHDREFLDEVADELIVLRKNVLTYFDGNLTDYERDTHRKLKFALRQQETLDKKKEKVQKSIADAAKSAKKSGDDNKMRMVKSRQRKLDERWGLEVNAKGHKFKLNRDMIGYFLSRRDGPDIDAPDASVEFSFPDPDELRFPGAIVHMEDVRYTYEGASQPTLKGVTLTIGPGERVALVGPNGHGKTTLLNTMVCNLTPTSGKVETHSKARMAIYAQHTIEELLSSCRAAFAEAGIIIGQGEDGRGGVQAKKLTQPIPGTTALSHFLAKANADGGAATVNEGLARKYLGQLGLKGRTADTIPLTGLSGGQLVRLGLAEVMWTAPDLVILDEVTTHLDSDTIDALVHALRQYSGAIVLVSHDRYAVKRIVEMAKDPAAESDDEDDSQDEGGLDGEADDEALVDAKRLTRQPGRTYLVRNGTMKLLERGMDQYTEAEVKRVEACI